MTTLDPLRIPLRGLTLIEASAGTGKTYSITTLYLRLLLELGLEVDQILVVTFTEAATEELRDRIRRRLVQALDWFRDDAMVQETGREGAPVLAELLSGLPDRDRARGLLADALTRLDEAAIYTIHGFCLRTLTDQAFESGVAFDAEFITDESRLRITAVADFWRAQVAGADPETARWVRRQWKTPQALLRDLESTLALDELRLLPQVGTADIEATRWELEGIWAGIGEQWREAAGSVEALLTASPALNRRSYTKKVVARALRTAAALAEATELPADLPADFERLTPAGLARGTKAGQEPPAHPFFDLCGHLPGLLRKVHVGAQARFLTTARRFVRAALERRKRDEGLLYYDDLLRRLDRALTGEGAEALAAGVRERYPVALIDEFQDTDPQQYRIFRRLYADRPDCGLFLIGDPKQAIYAFRGADIFTYMQARDDSARAGRRYSLTVNRRSGSRLVAAVNHLFASARKPFVYEDYIGFEPVAPGPAVDAEPLRVQGLDPIPLQFWMLRLDADNQTTRPPGFICSDAAEASAARACAESIAELLNQAAAGQATIGENALEPRDIALLVRTHREGGRVRQALRACGVGSVTLSKDSVFATEDAEELAILLRALLEPHDEGRVRAALATALLGHNATELARLTADELAWEALLARFQSYRERWRWQGILAALQELLAAERIPARLLRWPDGERRLTNLLQLMELLQVAADERPGPDQLLRWLTAQRAERVEDQARQLRLESDEGLVKVVTLHKSKGLEYPLVFIPFPWSYFKGPQGEAPVLFHAPVDKGACLDLGSEDREQHIRLARTEQLAERLRLFYVGVTRAVKLCVLCWGKINGIQDSAPAYLLHPDPDSELPANRLQGLSEDALRAELDALAAGTPEAIQIRDLPAPTGARWVGDRSDTARLIPREFRATIDTRWRVTSYSGLVRGEESERPDFDAAPPSPVPETTEPGAPLDPLFALPAGIQVGQFLHRLFEHLDFPQATGETLTHAIRNLLDRHGGLGLDRAAVGEGTERNWAPVVEELVTNVLDTWLDPAAALRLRDIPTGDRITELEFRFPVARLDPASLNATLALSETHEDQAEGLGFEPLRGMMHGFIDLVFRHRQRFYLVDYKSNRLGDRLAAYEHESLRATVRRNRYDLQYLIYTLALHRFLGQRLPGYHYPTHFGGVYYLFLRGMRPRLGPDCGIWHERPAPRLIAALDRLFADG